MHSLRSLLTLETDDLRDLAEVILHRDVESLKTLTDDEVKLMLAALEGGEKIIWILRTRARR